MSYALMNLWVRDNRCALLSDAWRMDLVIQSCTGNYLVDMDEETINLLQARYPGFQQIAKLPNYHGATRIKLVPAAGKHLYHLEMDVPPGCWIVWARMCHGRNEETNKVMINPKCGDHVCVNLLLNSPNVCSDDGLIPIAINALQKQVDPVKVEENVQVMKKVANLKKADLVARMNERIAELNDTQAEPPTSLLAVNQQLKDIIDNMDEDPCC